MDFDARTMGDRTLICDKCEPGLKLSLCHVVIGGRELAKANSEGVNEMFYNV